MLGPIAVCFMFYKQRHRAFYYFMVYSTLKFMKDVGKLLYHDPRPFWVDSEIDAFQCSTSYGNPSGHALESSGMGLAIYLDYYRHFAVFEGPLSGMTYKVLFLILWFIIVFSIGFTRLYLGQHSWN